MSAFTSGGRKRGKPALAKRVRHAPYPSGHEEDEKGEPVKIPKGPSRKPARQSPKTTTQELTGPGGEGHEIVFPTYTPLSSPKNPGLFNPYPPDMSGADEEGGVVLFTGNSYLCASKNKGGSFVDLDSTTFLPKLPKRTDDQVMIFVPRIQRFAWMMQHGQSPGTNDGNVRLAVAKASDLKTSFTKSWKVYDFTSSDFGFPGIATDRQDLSFTEKYLYLTTNIVGKGRIVIRIPLDELSKGGTISWQYTKPLDGLFQFSDLSQQNGVNTYMAGIVDGSTLRVFSCTDGNNSYQTKDLPLGSFPRASDGNLVSKDPNGVDWLTKGVANVSAVLSNGDDLWIAWDASASKAGDKPFYPNAHIRLARVRVSTWKVLSEAQVWNPDYAFAYGALAINGAGDVGYGVGVGGTNDFPMSCFGILGDFVVYYPDNSEATAGAPNDARWGDYITVRPSQTTPGKFSAFGYFTKKKSGGGVFQTPYYLLFGRP